MTKIDHAYAAGIVDGEGSISIQNYSSITSLRVEVVNTDPRICLWLKERFDGRVYQHPRTNGRRMLYKWTVASAAAGTFLKAICPYMILKKEQAEIALAYQQTMRKTSDRLSWFDKQNRLKLITKLNEARRERPSLRVVNSGE